MANMRESVPTTLTMFDGIVNAIAKTKAQMALSL